MFCQECNQKNICKKLCKELEDTLPHDQDGRLKGEFSISNDLIDRQFAQELDGTITDLNKPKKPTDH